MNGGGPWDWGLYPAAESFLQEQVGRFLANHSFARTMRESIEEQTATRFADWIDHLMLPRPETDDSELREIGYEKDGTSSNDQVTVYRHPGGVFFPVLLSDDRGRSLAVIAEDIDTFAWFHRIAGRIEGERYDPVRRVAISTEGDYALSALERRGSAGFAQTTGTDNEGYAEALDILVRRGRTDEETFEGFSSLSNLLSSLQDRLSPSRIADAFFRAERQYWQNRNRAGQATKERQDRLGLGLANCDHLTFRSSRDGFRPLISLLRSLGAETRERFYAGHQAGWGAQILEQRDCNTVLFTDVDLLPGEKGTDFLAHSFSEYSGRGTVGLWVDLHGESVCSAGLHHAAVRFSFATARRDLVSRGIPMMAPFSDFPFLKQAFSEGETWPVNRRRIDILEKKGVLGADQAARFRQHGALGSHLEVIERGQGFRGFNQDSVSVIIRETDPRRPGVYGA